jgi:hypothetical protein
VLEGSVGDLAYCDWKAASSETVSPSGLVSTICYPPAVIAGAVMNAGRGGRGRSRAIQEGFIDERPAKMKYYPRHSHAPGNLLQVRGSRSREQ